jgi:hypothetical protein
MGSVPLQKLMQPVLDGLASKMEEDTVDGRTRSIVAIDCEEAIKVRIHMSSAISGGTRLQLTGLIGPSRESHDGFAGVPTKQCLRLQLDCTQVIKEAFLSGAEREITIGDEAELMVFKQGRPPELHRLELPRH